MNGQVLSTYVVTAREAYLCGERGSPAVSGLSFFVNNYKALLLAGASTGKLCLLAK